MATQPALTAERLVRQRVDDRRGGGTRGGGQLRRPGALKRAAASRPAHGKKGSNVQRETAWVTRQAEKKKSNRKHVVVSQQALIDLHMTKSIPPPRRPLSLCSFTASVVEGRHTETTHSETSQRTFPRRESTQASLAAASGTPVDGAAGRPPAHERSASATAAGRPATPAGRQRRPRRPPWPPPAAAARRRGPPTLSSPPGGGAPPPRHGAGVPPSRGQPPPGAP